MQGNDSNKAKDATEWYRFTLKRRLDFDLKLYSEEDKNVFEVKAMLRKIIMEHEGRAIC